MMMIRRRQFVGERQFVTKTSENRLQNWLKHAKTRGEGKGGKGQWERLNFVG